MLYFFFVLAQICLGLSLAGILAILGRRILPAFGFAKVSFSWRPKINLPRKRWLKKKVKSLLQAEEKEKSHLKKDYWDKLLKK